MAELRKQEALAKQINSHYSDILKSPRANESPVHYLEARLETLEKYWTDTYNNHWSILSDPKNDDTDYIKKSMFNLIEEDYTVTKAAIIWEIKKLTTNERQPHTVVAQGNKAYDNTWKHLPALSIPSFSGNQLEWETFRDMFTAMVDKTKLSEVQKLYYLKSSLTGKAAERIKNLTINDNNYIEAWSMLLRRYDNKRILLATHMRKLLSCPEASKRSVDEILRLLDATNESIRAFSNMGRPVELWDDWFVHLLVHKLDPHTREEWEKHLKDSEEFPNFEDLASFLETSVRALEASHPSDKSVSTTSKAQLSKGKKQIISVNHAKAESSPSPKSCPLCQSSHFISYCPQLKKLKVTQRFEQVKRLNLCFNCLRSNHKIEDCPSAKICFVCSNAHHTFIHDHFQIVKTPDQSPTNHQSEQVNCHTSYLSNHLSHSCSSQSKGLFATAYIKLTSLKGQSIMVKSFLDSGSERTLITERVVQLLKLPKLRCDVSLKGVGNSSIGSSNYKANLLLQSPKDPSFQLPLQALVLKSLVHLVHKDRPKHHEWQHLENLDLADPNYHLPEQIDCIIGIDLLGHTLLPGLKQGPLNSPTALLTTFGWIIFGSTSSKHPTLESTSSIYHVEERDSLSNQLRAFWELEEIPAMKFPSQDESECEKIFREGHYRDQAGRYVVRLPLLKPPDSLGRSKDQVISMFKRNEIQLSKDPILKAKYDSFMQDYLLLNHMEPVVQGDNNHPFSNYLPHHVITKDHDPSSKIRVVFNGSYRTTTGVSLNDILHPGQKLQLDIWLVLTRWRFWRYVFTADIVKMFRQIRIDSPDCHLQRIIWRTDPSQPLVEYNLTTVTYGTRSAPFLAIRVLHQLAQDEQAQFPLGAQALRDNTYVDDIFAGSNSLLRADEIKIQLVNMLATVGITLDKWSANESSLLPDDILEKCKDKVVDPENSVSTLGLLWDPIKDEFHFSVIPTPLSNPTKREIASKIAMLYDPQGWLSPFLIRAKILLQDCWLTGTDWDVILPNNLQTEWNSFQEQLNQLSLIRIPRWIQAQDDCSNWELHGFADASERAYSAALFLIDRSSNNIQPHLLIAKTKLAPVKVITLPKLELSAALLLAKLTDTVIKNLIPSIVSVHYWTDSLIVLSWLQGHPSRWKPFVANRVSEIHSISKDFPWHHVPSKDNPADCATRGFTVEELCNSSLWWHGPSWLKENSSHWPTLDQTKSQYCNLEARSKYLNRIEDVHTHHIQHDDNHELLERFSSLSRLLRVTSFCFRFIRRSQGQNLTFQSYLTVEELNISLVFWIKLVQNEYFDKIIKTLTATKTLSVKDPITKLTPFLDKDYVLRVGGRLENSILSYDEKHPIILPKRSKLSELIVSKAHLDSLHGGQQLTLSRVLRKFWIISSKTLINKLIRNCVRCTRFRTTIPTQLMGQLPVERTTISKPFTFTGLDYAGPYHVLPSKGRGTKSFKGYICLFVCLSTRAIHLEVVSDYETKSFLAAFRRFVSRRGPCAKIFSDNARNFIGANRELKLLFDGSLKIFPQAIESIANQGTKWSFIPPHSPHFGGLWEAGVKSVKHHLRRVIGETRLTFEELTTVLCQIEACLNSRPLYPNPSDSQSVSAITPGHLLTGGPIAAIPEPMLSDLNQPCSNRWTILTKMRDDFWTKWSQEYLHHLQQRSKWLVETNVVKVGDIVLLREDNLPPTRWSLGRISQLHPGKDGLVRVATVETATSSFKRSFAKLALLSVPRSTNND